MSQHISIIIITLGKSTTLHACLKLVCVQARSGDEIIIISEKKIVLQETNKHVTLFVAPCLSQSQARNFGIAKSTHDWIAFIDDDCLPTPGWFRSMKQAIRTNNQCIQGLCLIHNKKNVWEVLENISMHVYATIPHKYARMSGPGIKLTTKNLLINKQKIPFRPVFPNLPDSSIHDDALLLLKLNRVGIRPIYRPSMTVFHASDIGGVGYISKLITDGRSLFWKHHHYHLLQPVLQATTWAPNRSQGAINFHKDMNRAIFQFVTTYVSAWRYKLIFLLFWTVRSFFRFVGYILEALSLYRPRATVIKAYLTH